ncbi:unnamed protein product [Rhizopus stolonifer]
MIEDFLCDYEARNNIVRDNRPFLVSVEATTVIEGRRLSFMKQKEVVFKEIARFNVQAYFDLDLKFKSGHIGGCFFVDELYPQQDERTDFRINEEVETAVKAYNEENAPFLRLPSSGDLQPLILEDVLREDNPLWEINWSKDVSMWLRENSKSCFSLWMNSENDVRSKGLRRIVDKKLKANARWRQVSDHYLSQIRFYEAGFSAVMHAPTTEMNDEDEIDLADEGDEEVEEEEEGEN